MAVWRVKSGSLFTFLLLLATWPASNAAEEAKPPQLTLEEIMERRAAAREQLMIPSLEGIRGLSYRVVGYKAYEPLEKRMGDKLKTLGLPVVRFLEMKEGQKPVDAILQVSFFKVGDYDVADLTATQWVSLLRDPKVKVRAVTYKDRVLVPHGKPETAVDQLTGQFVLDVLKANRKNSKSDQVGKVLPSREEGIGKAVK